MTRNEVLLRALATMEDTSGSTSDVAEHSLLPDRTVRRGMHALAKQGLVWSPRRGLWQLTSDGRRVAGDLRPSDVPALSRPESAPQTVLEALWSEGLAALFRGSRAGTVRDQAALGSRSRPEPSETERAPQSIEVVQGPA